MAEDDFFLSRWSRRKSEARRGEPGEQPVVPQAPESSAPAKQAPPPQAPAEAEPLPPVESLTTESDFTPFMRKDVDANLRGQALRTLFSDPRFNVMDGLDVYIDDYSKPDPLPAEWLKRMSMSAFSGHTTQEEKDAAAALEKAAEAPEQEPGVVLDEPPSDTASETHQAEKVGDSRGPQALE
jgi:hypothetical protein